MEIPLRDSGAHLMTSFRGAGTDDSRLALRFLAALYNQRITRPSDLWELLRFRTPDELTKVNEIIFVLFQARIKAWITGCGHPVECKSVVEEDDPFLACPPALLRAKLLATAMADDDLLPNSPSESYTVRGVQAE